MSPIRPELVALHKECFHNEEKVLQAKDCCCFDCANFFASNKVVDWIDDGEQKTAMCPNCGFDTVLPIDPSNPITEDLLKKMQTAYFGDGYESVVYSDFTSIAKAWEKAK